MYSNNPITHELINSVIRERDLSFMEKKKKKEVFARIFTTQ